MLTEPITGAALEASPERDGEASLLSEHSADVRRFHAAVAQNQRLLAERTAPMAAPRLEPVAMPKESMLPTEPLTRPGSPPKEWRSRSAEGNLIREDRRRYVELQRRKLREEVSGLAKGELVEKVMNWCSTLGIWTLKDLDVALSTRPVDPVIRARKDDCGRCGTKHLKDGNFCRRCGQRRQTSLSRAKNATAKAKAQREALKTKAAEMALGRVRMEEFDAL